MLVQWLKDTKMLEIFALIGSILMCMNVCLMASLINEMFYLKFIVLYSGNSQWPLTTVKELDWPHGEG